MKPEVERPPNPKPEIGVGTLFKVIFGVIGGIILTVLAIDGPKGLQTIAGWLARLV